MSKVAVSEVHWPELPSSWSWFDFKMPCTTWLMEALYPIVPCPAKRPRQKQCSCTSTRKKTPSLTSPSPQRSGSQQQIWWSQPSAGSSQRWEWKIWNKIWKKTSSGWRVHGTLAGSWGSSSISALSEKPPFRYPKIQGNKCSQPANCIDTVIVF